MNEAKTENIVRRHFAKYTGIILEEKQSDTPKIDKLLKNASKRGDNEGYPEFIISFQDNPDFLIVIECKANIKKHQSVDLKQYAEYAVDGSLLYGSFLSKEFDVMAIGVSGENAKEAKYSHFLFLKGESTYFEKNYETLLSPENYLNEYLGSPEKFRQDYNSLMDYSKELNDTLEAEKVSANTRSLLISCILIALENKAFKISYKHQTRPKALSKLLVDTLKLELEAKINPDYLDELVNQFSFIKTDPAISQKHGFLMGLITDIDNNINDFIKTHEYYDVLGGCMLNF